MIGEIKSYIYLYALSFLIHILLSSHNNKDEKVQFAKVICKMYIDILFEIKIKKVVVLIASAKY